MHEAYESKYYTHFDFLKQASWTEAEINTYVSVLESMNEGELLNLHSLCGITMFENEVDVDKEQAIHALINPKDTPKDILIAAIHQVRQDLKA